MTTPLTAMRRPSRFRAAFLVVWAVWFVAGIPGVPTHAAELDVSASQPAEVVITVPVSAVAGDPFTVRIEVRDRFGNVVTDFDRRGTGFDLSAAGRGEIWPKTVLPKAFNRGVAEVQVVYKVAERVELLVKSYEGKASDRLEGRSAPFHVTAGKLGDIRVVAPASARAGTPFRVTLAAYDAYGNIIRNFHQRSEGIILSADGAGLLQPARVAPAGFIDGVAEMSVTYSATGEIDLTARETKSGTVGRSATRIRVAAGMPAKFLITTPPSALVDESFDVAVTAVDALGNVVLDYDVVGTMVFLSCDGSAPITPAEIPVRKFSQGVAFVKASYSKPENITLTVSEPGTPRSGISAPIDMLPGYPRVIEVAAPPTAEAGVPFIAKIRMLDARGNPTAVPPTAKLSLSIAGSVRTTPIDLTSAVFKSGVAERSVTYNVAEEIMLMAQDAAGDLRSEPARVRIIPGAAVAVEPSVPSTVTAGAGIPVTLTALDAYRNVVTDFDRTKTTLTLFVDAPDAAPPVEVSSSAFAQGRALVTLNYYRAGQVRVGSDMGAARSRGGRGFSELIEILPGPLHHFDVSTPSKAQAGAAFRLTVTARDAYGNAVADYDRIGGGVMIHSTGVGEVQPAQIAPAAFRDGIAHVDARSYAAEGVVLSVSERFGPAAGRSGSIQVIAGPLSHFILSVPPKIRAGEMFPVRIEAQDMYYNTIRNLESPGRILLSISGQGKIVPSEIIPEDFNSGVAMVQATLTAAGTTDIMAATDDRRAAGRSNPIQVLAAAALAYKVDVLDPVTAGEPFRVRVNALDAYGNPVEDARGIGRAVRLEILTPGGAAQPITPSTFSPMLFSRGGAEGYLVCPQAGRITIQVRGGGPGPLREADSAEWMSQIEGIFFKATDDRTDVYVLADGPIEYRASQPGSYGGGFNSVVVTFPAASVSRGADYESLSLPGLQAAKLVAEAGPGGRLVLRTDASYSYSMEARANLLHITLRPGRPSGPVMLSQPADEATKYAIPSLTDIQSMIDAGDYRSARRAVELFLSAHPGHPEAQTLRARLDKVLRVLGQ